MPQWIIERKRDGGELSREELEFFIDGYTRGDIPDYQMAALAMAIYFQGMQFDETVTLTERMLHSGDLVDTSSIPLPKADKHSTGGVGDKVSLLLAPLIACCDVAVPMISGRGLGITGGTLDKLESIPGYRVDFSEREFLEVIGTCGCAIIGQTERLAPADRKLYALRDVTGTVPSIPLITASIMSKKMAEGIDALVMDVKWGKGAFMKTYENAVRLARTIVEVGARMDKAMAALITDMNQPLGITAGNAIEVIEAAEALKGSGASDLMEVTLELCVRILLLTGTCDNRKDGLHKLQSHIDSGRAFERFQQMVECQGGDPASLDDPDRLPTASITETITASDSGFLSEVSAEQIGKAVILLGGGRSRTEDRVDHAVGITQLAKVGDHISKGDRLCTVLANEPGRLDEAMKMLRRAFRFSEDPIQAPPLIKEIIVPEQLGATPSTAREKCR